MPATNEVKVGALLVVNSSIEKAKKKKKKKSHNKACVDANPIHNKKNKYLTQGII